MKHTINVQRPDGSNMKSFPSGHTATVFTGSHILFNEYKDSCPWIGIGAYGIATATGILRMTNNKSNSPPCQQALTGRGFHTTVRTVHVYSGSLRNGAIF